MLEGAAEEFVRTVDEGKAEAARLVLEAEAAAEATREQGYRDAVLAKVAALAEAQRLVEAAQRTAEQEASRIKADSRFASATIRFLGEKDAVHTRGDADVEVDRRVAEAVAERKTVVGDREATGTKAEGLVLRDRRDIEVRPAVVKTGAQTNRDRAAALDARDLGSATLANRLRTLGAELEPALAVVQAT